VLLFLPFAWCRLTDTKLKLCRFVAAGKMVEFGTGQMAVLL